MSGTRNSRMIKATPERLEGAPRQFRRGWSDEFKDFAGRALVTTGSCSTMPAFGFDGWNGLETRSINIDQAAWNFWVKPLRQIESWT